MTSPNSDHTSFDAIVIGAGSGGLTVAVGLARFGKSVALLERKHIGGDCTNVGCIPSKSLLHLTAQRTGSGFSASEAAGILERVREQRDNLRDHEHEEFSALENLTLLYGEASLLGDGRVELRQGSDTSHLVADHVILSTGSRPRALDLGLETGVVITNDELFELVERPDRLAIVGAGPVGLEMALAFARLGSAVTLIEAGDQVAPGTLSEAAEVVQRHLASAGVEFVFGTFADRSLPAVAEADKVLVAVGRRPNSEGLGLEDAGVEVDSQGRIVVDSRGRTSVSGVWATGDVADRTGTTHGANAWGRRIIKSIVAPPAPIGSEPVEPRVIFTEPELASIGEQPATPPSDVRRIRFELSEADRGYTDGLDDGSIILDIRRFSGKIIGATIVGPRAGELLAVISLAMHAGIPFHKWYGTVWPYPSYADALGRAVDLYMGEAMGSIPSDAAKWLGGRVRSIVGR